MVEVVTKLVVDSAGAVSNLAAFEAAMNKAGDAQAKSVTTMTTGPQSFAAVSAAINRVQASTDPVFAAQIKRQAEVERAFKAANAAVANGIKTHTEAAAIVGQVAAKHDALIASAQKGAFAQSTLGKAMQPVNSQLVALSAGAGPVGVFLSALGPWGAAAAIGLGALGAAFAYVESESLRMGQRAIDLRAFTDITGLAINEISALKKVGAEFGVTGDGLSDSFQRLTGQLTDARRASGGLYEDVRTINGVLASQLQQSTTTKAGIDALAKAWRAAGDEAAKATLAKAIFGKGGAANGPILGAIADAGGIDELVAKMSGLSNVTVEQNKQWAIMTAQIEETNKRAKNILAGIFTQEGLEAALLAAQYSERMAKAAAELGRQREGLSWWQKFFADIGKGEMVAGGADPAEIDRQIAELGARMRIGQGKGSNLAVDPTAVDSWVKYSDAVRGVVAPMEQASETLQKMKNDAAAEAKVASDRIGCLGSAHEGKKIDSNKHLLRQAA